MPGERWVKSWDRIMNWEWYTQPLTCHLFRHLIQKAQWKPTQWRGIDIPLGGLVTSLTRLSVETGLSVQQVRTSLERLESTGEITRKTTNKYTLLIVNNYAQYQGDNTQDNNQITIKQQTNNKQITTYKKEKTDKKEKNTHREDSGEFSANASKPKTKSIPEAAEVIDYWNQTYSKRFKATDQTSKQIKKLLDSGYTTEDMKKVIDYRAKEIQDNPDSKKWFTPTTVFRPENFERTYQWAQVDEDKQKEYNPWDERTGFYA